MTWPGGLKKWSDGCMSLYGCIWRYGMDMELLVWVGDGGWGLGYTMWMPFEELQGRLWVRWSEPPPCALQSRTCAHLSCSSWPFFGQSAVHVAFLLHIASFNTKLMQIRCTPETEWNDFNQFPAACSRCNLQTTSMLGFQSSSPRTTVMGALWRHFIVFVDDFEVIKPEATPMGE